MFAPKFRPPVTIRSQDLMWWASDLSFCIVIRPDDADSERAEGVVYRPKNGELIQAERAMYRRVGNQWVKDS